MRVAFISDIHANLIALEAVLGAIKKHHPERIISLGDQVNLGPCPRETLALLRSENVTCLHGNHERYILSVMAGDPAYSGANFNSLRYNAQLLAAEDITFPKELQLTPSILCTHAMPEDDRFPMYDVEKAFPDLAARRPDQPLHVICGHGHNPTTYAFDRLTLHSIGAVGCMDDGIPGAAPYVIAQADARGLALRPYYAAYDPSAIRPMFKRSGMPDFCPIMARIACMQMTHNHDFLVDFVSRALALSRARGESQVSEATWQEADRRYPWADGLTAAAFWK